MIKSVLSICGLIFLFASCASTNQYVKQAHSKQQSENTATVYVVRTNNFGSAIKFKIYQDDKLVGKLGPKSYLAWNVDCSKGEFTVVSKSENKDMVRINPQPGKTYYIKQKVKAGVIIARSGLEFISEEEATEYLTQLKEPKMKYAE